MNQSAKRTFPVSLLSCLIAAAVPAVQAQVQQTESQELEEVIVTAQKRAQSIVDVPLTISSLDGQTLKDLGIDRFDTLSDMIPGLVVQQQSVNNNGYVIRGITSDDGSAPGAARVSVYLNGTDVSRSRASYFEVYDMERIEVVKGPQATLFGTAASIGAMSFITAKPQRDFASELTVGAGDYGMRKVEGMTTGGNDTVQGRFAFVSRERDGYVENTSGEADLNGYDRLAYRPSLRITPNDALTIDLIYNYDKAEDPGTAFVSQNLLFTDDAALSVPDNDILGMDDVGVDRTVKDFNATVSWDIDDHLALTYIGAWRDYDSLEAFDADGTAFEVLNFSEEATGDQISHELRLNFSGERLNGFVGASYFQEEAEQFVGFATEEGLFLSCAGALAAAGIESCNTASTTLLTGGLASALPYESYYANGADNRSLNLFADISYQVTPDLEATVGARWVEEERESSYRSALPLSSLLSAQGIDSDLFFGLLLNTQGETIDGDADDSAVLPRFNLLYSLNDSVNLYGTVSLGQRSEVVDMSSGVKSIIPAEEITNYEFGLKGRLEEVALDYALAIFYQDYENFQVNVVDQDSGQIRTENAGSATNTGIEMDLRWSVSENLMLLANAAYIDAGIDDDADNGIYAGNQFRLQPEVTGALSYLYERPINADLIFTSSGSWSYRSSVYFDIENRFEEDAVDLLNLRAGIAANDYNWSLTLAASNLLDEEYIMDAGNTGDAFGFPTYIQGAPRTLSLEFSKRIGAF
ncbi:Outer membrane receptor proteins, mostly Fe transport [Microbulbifer thermotolerans]|uniref:TonB-dependent receptor n=1 Tax=Microbulbifer thermotolerans TaxID=252514 RepID=UPI0008EBD445|nr:TonB-dependent receptor [Microbulbifer thermotolerans]SFC31575.1 Outer membrane receptor proteins, mostly Fe transport [Microbulbifer thermotolerans]